MNVWLPPSWHICCRETLLGWSFTANADYIDEVKSQQFYPNEKLASRAARHALRVAALKKKAVGFTPSRSHACFSGATKAWCGRTLAKPQTTRELKMRECQRCVWIVKEIERAISRLDKADANAG